MLWKQNKHNVKFVGEFSWCTIYTLCSPEKKNAKETRVDAAEVQDQSMRRGPTRNWTKWSTLLLLFRHKVVPRTQNDSFCFSQSEQNVLGHWFLFVPSFYRSMPLVSMFLPTTQKSWLFMVTGVALCMDFWLCCQCRDFFTNFMSTKSLPFLNTAPTCRQWETEKRQHLNKWLVFVTN